MDSNHAARCVLLVGLAVLAGCGSHSGPADSGETNQGGGAGGGTAGEAGSPPTIASFTAVPATLNCSGGSATLAWVVNGADRTEINQGLGVQPAATSSTTVAVSATTQFTLTASNAYGASTAHTTVTVPTTCAIRGAVVASDFRSPLPGAQVLLVGRATALTADEAGAFSLSNVTRPYTLAVRPAGSSNVVIYEGLTRLDPVIACPHNDRLTTHAGSIDGTLINIDGGSSLAVGMEQAVAFSGGGSNYQLPLAVAWDGDAGSITGAVHALSWKCSGTGCFGAWEFDGAYSRSGVTVANGAVASLGNMNLTPIASTTIYGTCSSPFGASGLFDVEAVFADGARLRYTNGDGFTVTSGCAFTEAVPAIAGVTVDIEAQFFGPNGEASRVFRRGIVPDGGSIALVGPEVPQPLLPADQSNGIARQATFSWAQPASGAVLIDLRDQSGAQWSFFGASSPATLPDLTALGRPLAPTTSYDWSLSAFSTAATVDAFASGSSPTAVDNSTEAIAGPRSFTTAP